MQVLVLVLVEGHKLEQDAATGMQLALGQKTVHIVPKCKLQSCPKSPNIILYCILLYYNIYSFITLAFCSLHCIHKTICIPLSRVYLDLVWIPASDVYQHNKCTHPTTNKCLHLIILLQLVLYRHYYLHVST